MASKRKRLRVASCLGKATYRSKADALKAAQAHNKRLALPPSLPLDVYECLFGAHWHCGHNYIRTSLPVMSREFASEFAGV